MKTPAPFGIALALLYASLAPGQSFELDNFNPLSTRGAGVHLYGVSGSLAYFSGASLLGLTGLQPGLTGVRPLMAQGTASMGWARQGQSSQISVVYSPSMVRSFNLSGYQSLNHSLSAYGQGRLGAKWGLSGSFQGIASDFSQLLFTQTSAGRLSSAQASFDDLVSAILGNTAGNSQLAAVAGAAPLASSPEAAYLFGSRLLSVGMATALVYEHSTRSSFRLSFNGVQTQFLNDRDSVNPAADQLSSQLLRSTSGMGSLNWSYALTPRSTLGANLSAVRTFSGIQDGYTTHVTVSLGRKMTPNLFLRGMAGMGRYVPVTDLFQQGSFAQHEFGGGVGYKLYSHTLVASFDRSVSDIFGLGANATITGTGAWTWRRPGSSISVSGTGGYSQLTGPRFLNSGSWTGFAALSKALDAHSVISVAFRYLQYPQQLFVLGPDRTQTGVIITYSWSPAERGFGNSEDTAGASGENQ